MLLLSRQLKTKSIAMVQCVNLWGVACLQGTKGFTNKMELSSTKTAFESGHKDVFHVTAREVGDLMRLLITHDGTGMGADWHLEKVRPREQWLCRLD